MPEMFVTLRMPPVALNSVIDDPLAGSLPLIRQPGNGATLLRSLLMRLRLFLDERRSTAIGDQVIAEAKEVLIFSWEYVINEVQYELRRCQHGDNPQLETVVLNNWTKDLLRRYPEDVVWEFFKQVRKNRGGRKR